MSIFSCDRQRHFLLSSLSLSLLLCLQHSAWADDDTDHFKLVLKNAYIDRNYDSNTVKDTGSWSQGASLFYDSHYHATPIDQLQVGVEATTQYAVRLSDDKHVADTVLPFDNSTKKQAADYLKYGGTLKFKYQNTEVKMGELWLDLPVTTVDRSRQLLTSYWGANMHSQINDDLSAEIGRVTKVSPRNQEGFHHFAYTTGGKTYYSDGLNYLDVRYRISPNLKAEYYYGNLENLYDKHYLGLDHAWKLPTSTDLILNSKLKYFNSQDNNSHFKIDSQNIGLLETLKYQNHAVSLGYQQIIGDAYPLPDGYLPETYFINWNVTGFFKAKEKSWHFVYCYDFKAYIPGLSMILKHVYGYGFKTTDNRKNNEQESNVILNYNFQQKALQGLSIQYLYAPYRIHYGTDFDENRIFLTYVKKF
ncbi:OprD family outer membrane porin [Acinetobacter sp. ANC 3791]|uniref:OprD family outer membrane porin n=1 Tax=Acinetobacter sp. ANC 3791 TaxID=2529836 RepID=UPI001D195FA6|nr:OprD family outer membrane porin [Acinetobacter sp. ANC 3791]